MSYVESRNHVNSHISANFEMFESWRQLVEVMLHCLLHSDMKKELKIAVLFELVQDLLLKACLISEFVLMLQHHQANTYTVL